MITEIEVLSRKIRATADQYHLSLAEATRIVLRNYRAAQRLGLTIC